MEFLRHQFQGHLKACPEAVLSCEAAIYGCDYQAKNSVMDDHRNICPLAKLAPFLKAQNECIERHERALDILKTKHDSLEKVLYNITETLETFDTRQQASGLEIYGPVSHSPEPYDATTHHLLGGHESLRKDVERMSREISNVDAKASMMVMNESLHWKNDLDRANAAINSIRMQLNWLTSANHRREFSTAPHAAPGNVDPLAVRTDPHQSSDVNSPRRLSDGARQDPKL
ncbi:MAG: hypothetical protein Q9213_003719 [Squamulea squamosa]